jgi:hypothetical protein
MNVRIVSMKAPVSELAWHLADFLEAGSEPPPECISSPHLTQGEMMTDEEVDEFLKDSVATLRILSDHSSPRYVELMNTYLTDLAYLSSLGRITEDDYNELTHPDNLRF